MLVPTPPLRRSRPATSNLPGLLEKFWAKFETIPAVTREDISVLKNDWLTDNVSWTDIYGEGVRKRLTV